MLDSFYLQYLFGGFVSLIVITNPLSKIPLFISLTQGMSLDVRKKQANWSCYYAAAIMLVSLAAGNLLLVFFGISYGALRISGGFVVGIIGYQMLFGSRDQGGAQGRLFLLPHCKAGNQRPRYDRCRYRYCFRNR